MSSEIPVNPSDQDTSNKSEIDILSETDSNESTDDTSKTEEEESEETTEEDSGESVDENVSEEVEEEIKEEVAEDSEEDIEAEAKITRPSWKTVKEKYPELAKDKDFRELFFRDQAMTEIFPTVAEARNASQAIETLMEVDSNLVNGNIDKLVSSMNPEIVEKLADKILPALYAKDKKYFQRATQPLIIDLLHNAYEFAGKSRDENLRKSVRHLSNYLTNSPDLPNRKEIPSESPEVKQEIEKLRAERFRLYKEGEKKFLTSSDNLAHKKVESLILADLDPNKELTEFAKNAIIEKTIKDVTERLKSDEGLNAKIKSLLKLAARDSFSDSYKSRIVNAYLERARKLIPTIRNKYKIAALGKQPSKGTTKITADIGNKENETTGNTGRITSAKQIDTNKTSAEDFLSGKVVLRK